MGSSLCFVCFYIAFFLRWLAVVDLERVLKRDWFVPVGGLP